MGYLNFHILLLKADIWYDSMELSCELLPTWCMDSKKYGQEIQTTDYSKSYYQPFSEGGNNVLPGHLLRGK